MWHKSIFGKGGCLLDLFGVTGLKVDELVCSAREGLGREHVKNELIPEENCPAIQNNPPHAPPRAAPLPVPWPLPGQPHNNLDRLGLAGHRATNPRPGVPVELQLPGPCRRPGPSPAPQPRELDSTKGGPHIHSAITQPGLCHANTRHATRLDTLLDHTLLFISRHTSRHTWLLPKQGLDAPSDHNYVCCGITHPLVEGPHCSIGVSFDH